MSIVACTHKYIWEAIIETVRKPISKTIRFEVFKRDSFKCVYCGSAAPEVILHVDHIQPISKGGSNDIVNLATACQPCNLGKKARTLDDKSIIEKSRNQMEELQQRKDQLDMMMEWHKGLSDLKDQTLELLATHWSKHTTGFRLNETGKAELKKIIRLYPIDEIMTAMDISAENYLAFENNKCTDESFELGFNKIVGILKMRKIERDDPDLAKLKHCHNILKKRVFAQSAKYHGLKLLQEAYNNGSTTDDLMNLVTSVRNWTEFTEKIDDLCS